MLTSADQFADWLVSGLELRSTLFHLGRYCGTYRASTAGYERASFHLVLAGTCWLHLAARNGRSAQSIQLFAGDSVFLLQDRAHCLTPDERAPANDEFDVRIGQMTPLEDGAKSPSSVSLACGFFEFRSDVREGIRGVLPDHIVASSNDEWLAGARAIFDLIRAEAARTKDGLSPIINRLTDVLFLYALRAVAMTEALAPGLWSVMRREEFAPLVNAVIKTPGADWNTSTMASFCHMSRARFCRQFVDVCGVPPARFLALLRMKEAAEMIRAGASVLNAAEHVGYQSESAFAQAFKRVTGVAPGTFRRDRLSTTEASVH